jgi:type I restriction enzyme S subunit
METKINNSQNKNEHYELPLGWKWVRLDEVCKVFSGSSAPQEKKYFENGRYPFVRVQDLGRFGRIDNLTDVKDSLNDLAIQEFHLVKAEKGTILFPKSGAAIATNNRAILGTNAFIVSHLAAVKPREGVADTHFVYYWLCLTNMVQYMENPGYPSLKLSIISKIPLPLPPFREQRRIATKIQELMKDVERARAACEKQLEAAKALPSAYLREVFESAEAKKWERKRLGEVCQFCQYGLTATAKEKGGFPYLRITDIDDLGNIKIGNIKYIECNENVYKKYKLEKGDILFARSGSIGRTFLYNGIPSKAIFASYLIKFRMRQEIIDPFYLFCYTHSSEYYEFTEEKKHTVSQSNINAEEYKSLLIPLPPLETQRRIASKLKEQMDYVNKLCIEIGNQLEKINSLPQAILTKAFRGKI